MKRLIGKVKIIKPNCNNCKYSKTVQRKWKTIVCKIYNQDVPVSGCIYPIWCNNKYEVKKEITNANRPQKTSTY